MERKVTESSSVSTVSTVDPINAIKDHLNAIATLTLQIESSDELSQFIMNLGNARRSLSAITALQEGDNDTT